MIDPQTKPMKANTEYDITHTLTTANMTIIESINQGKIIDKDKLQDAKELISQGYAMIETMEEEQS